MFNKVWDFMLSDDIVERLIARSVLVGLMVGIGVFAYNANTAMMIGLGCFILLVVILAIAAVVTSKRADRAEAEYRRRFEEVDDGVTGYIAVRPEELEGAPWEVKKRKPKTDVTGGRITGGEANEIIEKFQAEGETRL
jgi:hypothetical protein